MPAQYSFVTHWRIEAPIDAVWDAIYESEKWPEWWLYVQRVQKLQAGDENGVGAVHRISWKTALPYTIVFDSRTTRVERPRLLEIVAFGELDGTGRWALETEGAVTHVRYDWNVSTKKAWMNALAPLLRPAFEWNHDKLMTRGGQDLARYLGARLVSAS